MVLFTTPVVLMSWFKCSCLRTCVHARTYVRTRRKQQQQKLKLITTVQRNLSTVDTTGPSSLQRCRYFFQTQKHTIGTSETVFIREVSVDLYTKVYLRND